MKIIKQRMMLQTERKKLAHWTTVGLVPTMGALHKGHVSLIQQSVKENNVTVVSIFVNPTQFDNQQDYEYYPKTLDADLALLSELGVDYVWIPDEKELYPEGYVFSIDIRHPFSQMGEGLIRPGHFNGVLTVVLKLLQVVQPGRAYFGEKDYQQYCLIKACIEDFFMPIEIVCCPTIREPSQLPYSSRHARLSEAEKILAHQASEIIHQAEIYNIEDIRKQLEQLGILIDYINISDNRLFSAIRIGGIRLIDNFIITGEKIC